MNRTFIGALAALLLSSCATTPAPAPTAAEAPRFASKSAEGEREGGADAPSPVSAYRLRSTLTIEADGRFRITREERYVLLTSAPHRYFAQIDAEFDPSQDERPELFAEVRLPDGTMKQLDQATVAEAPLEGSSADNFSDRRRVVAPIPALQAGASVTRRTSRVVNRPLGDFGRSWSLQMATSIPSEEVSVVVEHHRTLSPTVVPFGLEAIPVREEHDDTVRLTFTATRPPAVDLDFNLPPDSRRYPAIFISTAKSWQEVARGYLALLRPALDPAPLRQLASELEPASDAPRDVAAAALDWMHHHLRYTGLDFENGGVIPQPAGETLRRGYGDCKDLAAFLVALLDAAGVRARVALVFHAPWADGPEETPGLQRFNHAIVYVPGSDPLWIDPTMRGSEPGALSDFSVDRPTLVVDEGEKVRIRTPLGTPGINRAVIHTDVTLPELGSGTIRISRSMQGSALGWRRDRAIQQTAEQLERSIGAEVESSGGSRDFTYRYSDPLSARSPFQETVEIRDAKTAVAADIDAVAPNGFEALLDLIPKGLSASPEATGAGDFFVGAPAELEMVTRVHVHPLYRLQGGADRKGGEAAGIRWSYSVEPRPDGAEARLHLVVDGPVVPAAEREAVHRTLKDLYQLSNRVSFENMSFRHLTRGELEAASAELRRLAREDPESGWIRALQARLALKAGLAEEARRLAREAARLAPDSAAVLRTVAWVLAHDSRLRLYGAGMDREGALAAIEHALTIEPEEKHLVQLQIELLAQNAEGELAGEGADVDRALEQLRSYRSQSADAMETLYFRLLWRQKLDEELVRESEKSASSLRVAAIARSRGADEALASLGKSNSGEGEKLLAAAVFELYIAREYPLAHQLALRARDPNMAMLKQILGSLQKREDVPLRLDQPSEILIEAFAHAMGAKVRSDAAQLGLTEESRDALGTVNLGKALPFLAGADDAMIDTIRSLTSADQREIPGVGVLVTFRVPPARPFRVLYEKTDAGLRLHRSATAAAWTEQAWKAWEAGDAERARGWLDVLLRISTSETLRGRERVIRSQMAGSMDALGVAIAVATLDPGKDHVRVLPVLERAARQQPDRQVDAEVIGFSYANALMQANRYDDTLAQIDALEEHGFYPDTESALRHRLNILARAGRGETLEALGTKTLENDPGSSVGWSMLARAAALRGDMRAWREIYLRMADAGVNVEFALNNAAWSGVFLGVEDEDIRLAERAIAASPGRASVLDTLAVLLAEKGEADRALRTLEELDKLRGSPDPEPSELFARARIAEALGFTAAAGELYGQVKSNDGFDDLQPLALKRAAALEASR